ncbi:hypothetical protein RHGRI_035423 [Rhododendron griersonianum]|uniref:Uncharacterized protein n=1 Tax=Rhododendron griersonianum TaxID=479676 RepID=A0AAV6I7Q3_9ERIC|nr:hypothetical protein RHGRI_035423 [Rhododendron griersonianum]
MNSDRVTQELTLLEIGETVSQPELVDQVEVELANSVDTLMKQLISKKVEFYRASLHGEIAVAEMLWVLLKELPLKVSRVKMDTIQKSFQSRMGRNWSISHEKMPDGEGVINLHIAIELKLVGSSLTNTEGAELEQMKARLIFALFFSALVEASGDFSISYLTQGLPIRIFFVNP